MLYLVATPIGNLDDISLRALETLKKVDIIASEDTRHTKRLLNHFEIQTPCISFHAGSDPEKIVRFLEEGQSVALVSDAGTPLVSDPGGRLVGAVVEKGIPLSPIPGASAVLSALIASGFPINHFEFCGFLPHKKGREKFLKEIAEKEHTCIFFESTHRIMKFLEQAQKIWLPTRQICLAREMTKIHEEFLRGTASELHELLTQYPEKQKGEFSVVVKMNSN